MVDEIVICGEQYGGLYCIGVVGVYGVIQYQVGVCVCGVYVYGVGGFDVVQVIDVVYIQGVVVGE